LAPEFVRSAAADRLKALGHHDRLRIVEVLAGGPKNVSVLDAMQRRPLLEHRPGEAHVLAHPDAGQAPRARRIAHHDGRTASSAAACSTSSSGSSSDRATAGSVAIQTTAN